MFGLKTIGKLALSGGVMLMVVGCGGPSRTDRALAEKDRRIREMRDRESQIQEQQRLAEQRSQQALEQQRIAEQQRLAAEQRKQLLEQQQQKIIAKNKALASQTGQLASALEKQKEKERLLQQQIAELKKIGSKEGDVTVRVDELGAITIHIANSVLFDPGKATLKSSSFSTLSKVASTLKRDHPDKSIRIEGHTDSTPVVRNKHLFKDNMALSQARSKAVYDHMVRKNRMPANRMYTAGYSYFQPRVWPEKTRADRAKNRRVDIVILPNIKVKKESLASNR